MGSNVADLAREEAARAEAETPDAPEQPELPDDDEAEEAEEAERTDAPEQPAQPEGITQAMAEAILDSLTRYKQVVGREVEKRAKVMWDDLAPCPCCMELGPAPGFIFPVIPEPDGSIRRQIVAQALGAEAPAEYGSDPDTEECARCGGLGMMRTGSKVANQETRVCTSCNGQGWRLKSAMPSPPQIVPAQIPSQPWQPPNGAQQVATDPWGRHAGHPHYGISPDLIGA